MMTLCSNNSRGAVPVTDRIKKQLLWAYDADGRVDAGRFLTILLYEHVHLTVEEMIEVACELTPAARQGLAAFVISVN